VVAAGVAYAKSGHFVGTPVCQDIGTQCQCSGKVAGLGGTTFEITSTAPDSTASVECTNPGGNVAPGQDTAVTATGTGGPQPTPRNGQARFNFATAEPTVTGAQACPNASWTADVVDVTFGDITLTLLEDNNPSDTIVVPCPK
jgi:hypothetical protein